MPDDHNSTDDSKESSNHPNTSSHDEVEGTIESGTKTIDNQISNSKLENMLRLPAHTRKEDDSHILKPIRIRLYRNNETRVESYEFMPRDDFRLDVLGTGISKATEVIMRDMEGRIRFRARSGGIDHVFRTKLQYTTSFGNWRVELIYPNNLEEMEVINIEFSIHKKLPPVHVPEHLRVMEIDGEEFEPIDEDEVQEIIESEFIDEIEDKVLEKQNDRDIQTGKDHGEVISSSMDPIWKSIPITEVEEIEPIFRTKLFHALIKNLQDFFYKSSEDIVQITSAPSDKVNKWIKVIENIRDDPSNPTHMLYLQLDEENRNYIQSIERFEQTEEALLPVSSIKFIGVKSEEKLNSIGIRTVIDLLRFDENKLDTAIIQRSLFHRWVLQAHNQHNIKPFNLTKRLAELKKQYSNN